MKKIRTLFCLVAFLLSCSVCFGQEQFYVGVGEYVMSDVETPDAAKQYAKSRAEQNAVEQAGVYIESYSKSTNAKLVHDEVVALTNGIIKIISVDYDFRPLEHRGGSFLVIAKVGAVIDTKSVDEWLKQDAEKRVQLIKMNDELKDITAALEKENDSLRQQLLAARNTGESTALRQKLKANSHKFEANEKRIDGMRLLSVGDNQNALRLFNESIKLDPDNALSYCNRGEVYIILDQPEKAVEDCDKAIAMAPQLNRSYRIRARAYVMSKLYDPRPMDMSDAINDINKYLSSGYDDLNLEQAYMIRATAYYLQNQLDLALDDFKRASMENPYDPNYYIAMAQIYARIKRYDGILDMADKALAVDQNCYNAYYWKSIYYFYRYCQTNDRSYLETAIREARKDPTIESDAEGRRLMEELNKAYIA